MFMPKDYKSSFFKLPPFDHFDCNFIGHCIAGSKLDCLVTIISIRNCIIDILILRTPKLGETSISVAKHMF